MLNKYGTLLLSLLNACLFCMCFKQWKQGKIDNEATATSIRLLKQKNDSLDGLANVWQQRCLRFQNRADSLSKSLPKIKQAIQKINTHKHEKEHILDSCSVTELVSFFANLKTRSPSGK